MIYPEYTKQVGTKYLNSSQIGSPELKNEYGSLNNLLKVVLTLGYNERVIESVSIEGEFLRVEVPLNHGYVENQVVQLTGFTEESLNKQFRVLDYNPKDILIHKPKTLNSPVTVSETTKVKVAPLGYSIVYSDETSGTICFKNKSTHSPAILKVIDALPPNGYDPTWAKYGRVVIGEAIDSKGNFINNRKAPFHYEYPDSEKTGNGVSGSTGVHGFAKWDYAIRGDSYDIAETYTWRGTYPTDWRIIGDDKTFYLMIRSQGKSRYGYNLLGYGNYESNNPKETSNICLQARDWLVANQSINGFSRFMNWFGKLTETYTGFILTNTQNNHQTSNYNRSQNIALYAGDSRPWRSSWFTNPNPVTGKILTQRMGIKDCDNYFRGYHRGIRLLYGNNSLPDQYVNEDGTIILEVQEPENTSTDLRAPMVFTLSDWEAIP